MNVPVKYFISFFLGISLLVSCQNQSVGYKGKLENPSYMHRSMQKLTDVIVYDIFSPPVASRIYTYPSVAAYEILRQKQPEKYTSLQEQLTDFKGISPTETGKEYSLELASIKAFLTVGKAMVFSEDKIEAFETEICGEMKAKGIPTDVYERSIAYGTQVAKDILLWADSDNYNQTRSFSKFTVTHEKGRWKPTPPDYMEGIEPHWNEIRPFVIDSATQFIPEPPTPFDLDKSSQFYTEMMEVYETVNNLTEEQEAIAKFWDCNPYVSTHRGHAMFALKKITPGGHWMGITALTCKKANASLMKSIETYTWVSIALFDGFISCWDEKYRSSLIRPETIINETIDEDWLPLLQTPPFPEYTSGHSVISTSAATVLTHLYGDNFTFADSTELDYGLGVRIFDSFKAASDEAAISRLYGGIHYMPAIKNGVKQGGKVGEFIVNNMVTRPSSTTANAKSTIK